MPSFILSLYVHTSNTRMSCCGRTKYIFFPVSSIEQHTKFTRDVHFVFSTTNTRIRGCDRQNKSVRQEDWKENVFVYSVEEKQHTKKRTFCLSIQSISGITGEMGGWWWRMKQRQDFYYCHSLHLWIYIYLFRSPHPTFSFLSFFFLCSWKKIEGHVMSTTETSHLTHIILSIITVLSFINNLCCCCCCSSALLALPPY